MKRKLLVDEFNSEIRRNSWNVVDDVHNNYQPTAPSMSQVGILNCSLSNNSEVTFGKDVKSCEFNTTQP